jgi:hypothetical protein
MQKAKVHFRNGHIVVDIGMNTVHPIRYSDGRVAWDTPEIVPKYAKLLTVRFFDMLKAKGKPALNDYMAAGDVPVSSGDRFDEEI